MRDLFGKMVDLMYEIWLKWIKTNDWHNALAISLDIYLRRRHVMQFVAFRTSLSVSFRWLTMLTLAPYQRDGREQKKKVSVRHATQKTSKDEKIESSSSITLPSMIEVQRV